jgi:Membrane bound O-acyl transferase family
VNNIRWLGQCSFPRNASDTPSCSCPTSFCPCLSSCNNNKNNNDKQLLLIQVVIQLAFAVFIYRFIIQQRGTTAAFLFGYGIVLPLAIFYIPFELLERLDIHNRAIKMGAGTCAIIIGFRVVEAMHGTSPNSAVVESSLGTYLVYYSSLMHFEWNAKTGKRARITMTELTNAVMRVVLHYLALSMLLSFLMPYHYRPFPTTVKLDEWHFNTDLILQPGHLANMYCLAILTYLVLAFGFEMTALADQAQGYRTKPIFLNPLLTSRSPSEFWGAKWNLMIQRMLRHGIFLPARKSNVSAKLAVMLTFVASGLLHELSWALIFYQHYKRHHRQLRLDEATGTTTTTIACQEVEVCIFTPIPTKLVAFFAWNGVIMLLERPFMKYCTFAQTWPTPVVSSLILLTALPVSHWYTGDWAVGGYFSDLSLGTFLIKQLP